MKKYLNILLLSTLLLGQIPDTRIVAEWEPALGTLIRWPLGIPSDLVVELASDDFLYVLVENNSQENSARNSFSSWNVNLDNVEFIYTQTYSHWTRDHGPQFLIGQNSWSVVNQQFDGYPEESGCSLEDSQTCDEGMIMVDCSGNEFCNNQPEYAEYDCYVGNDSCSDFNGDGVVSDWLGDDYCDDGTWGVDFLCNEYSWDCGDCGELINDDNGYCDQSVLSLNRYENMARPHDGYARGWEEDDDTNIDFANHIGWDILDLPLFWTGGNFMTDGYGMGFSTELMVNENNLSQSEFLNISQDYLNLDTYHIFDNPNELSIQHIDCMAKLVGPETIIIKQVSENSPEYECIENFAESFEQLNTFYGRPFEIHRIFCPSIVSSWWEINPVAAYTNSLILNNKVLVPQYGNLYDQSALEVYTQAMPGYEVIGFDNNTNEPWYGEDALHCRTMGIFDPEMIHISHKSIRTEEVINNSEIYIEVEVLDYGLVSPELETVTVHWKYASEDGPFGSFSLLYSDNIYMGQFPQLNSSSEIEYYIEAINTGGKTSTHPNAGFHTFTTQEGMFGDINQDLNIDVLDVVVLVNYILSLSDGDLIETDLNNDNVVNVLDVIILINLILQ